MFHPRTITQFSREGEIRSMIAFIDALVPIKAALKELDTERARIAEAQIEAREVSKQADFKSIETQRLHEQAAAKHAAIATVQKAAEERMAEAEKLVAAVAKKEGALGGREHELQRKEEAVERLYADALKGKFGSIFGGEG